MPYSWAYDFLLFSQRNPKPCPILEVTEVGDPFTKIIADHADIRFDLPKYNIYINGKLQETVDNIEKNWKSDFVAFLIGCSFSFEGALINAGLKIRHIDQNANVPMYKTNIKCIPTQKFRGN